VVSCSQPSASVRLSHVHPNGALLSLVYTSGREEKGEEGDHLKREASPCPGGPILYGRATVLTETSGCLRWEEPDPSKRVDMPASSADALLLAKKGTPPEVNGCVSRNAPLTLTRFT